MPTECGDTTFFRLSNRDTIYNTGSKEKYYFDKSGRLIKVFSQDKRAPMAQSWTTEYFYFDSVSKRIKLEIQESPNSYTKVTSYHYENDKLIKTYELFYGHGQKSNYQHTRTNSYEYYPDSRLKLETTTTNCKPDRTSEYKYIDE
jgi:hypothetical protein